MQGKVSISELGGGLSQIQEKYELYEIIQSFATGESDRDETIEKANDLLSDHPVLANMFCQFMMESRYSFVTLFASTLCLSDVLLIFLSLFDHRSTFQKTKGSALVATVIQTQENDKQ